jgi:hypothetical protein
MLGAANRNGARRYNWAGVFIKLGNGSNCPRQPGFGAGLGDEGYCAGNSFGWTCFTTGGGFHFPVRASLFGAWSRMVRLNPPFGVGSQFASLSAPGLAFWK